MSFLNSKTINPHIHLNALSFSPLSQHADTPLQRLNLLARTRKFDQIQEAASVVKDLTFPTLANKLSEAKNKSEQLKKSLGGDRVLETIKQLQLLAKQAEPDFQKIDAEHERMYKLAQILFDEGRYEESLQITVLLEKQDLKQELWLKTTWARLYAEIVLKKDSTKTIEALKKKIDEIQAEELTFYAKEKKQNSKIMRKCYAQKEEFLILACFSFFQRASDDDLQKFVQFCTGDKSYFSVVQLTFPEILRYLIVAIALNKTLQNNRNFDLFKLVEVINRKIVKYTDAFTTYISLLEIEYDFDGAASKIESCRAVIKNDIFLAPLQEQIIEGLQFLYFKLACKVYETISLSLIASFTGKSLEDAEFWILSYIRSGDIEAKIDSIGEMVINHKGRQNTAEKYVDVVPTVSTFVNSLSRAINNQ